MSKLTIYQNNRVKTISFTGKVRLSDLLTETPHPCGGHGKCQKCAVNISGALSPLTDAEKKAGTRLSCQTVLHGDAVIQLDECRSVSIEENTSSIPLGKAMAGRLGAAVDIGTTTLAVQVYDLANGKLRYHATALNPQTSVAADVMGRIGAAMSGKGKLLRQMIVDALEQLLRSAAGEDFEKIDFLVVCGNTAMLYLLKGIDPASLSAAPFQADCLFDETDTLWGKTVYYPPCISAFVGADITCAMLAAGMDRVTRPTLLCDIGTNGEIALHTGEKLLVTSTAAGPCFEGAGISCGCLSQSGAIDRVWIELGKPAFTTIDGLPPIGVCGSGLLDAVAVGLELEQIDETGAMDEPFTLCAGIALQSADIRSVQLAKAAIAAGIQTLLQKAELPPETIDTCLIAGGFGKHLHPQSAVAIGLLDAAFLKNQRAIGNAALEGAAMLLLDEPKIEVLRYLAQRAQTVNLGGDPAFNDAYIEQMLFPEQ